MADWRVVKSLLTLRDQINALAPGRSKASDGTIGDAAHQAGTSDHNPARYSALGSTPVVCALDVTQDPAHGADMGPIAEALRQSRDRRIGYVIFNHRITGPNHGWRWDPYSGSDPHTNHMHVSSVHTAAADDTSPWSIGAATSEGDKLDANQAQMLADIHYTLTTNDQGLGAEHIRWATAMPLLEAIAAKVGVDVDALADKVVEKLEAKLAGGLEVTAGLTRADVAGALGDALKASTGTVRFVSAG